MWVWQRFFCKNAGKICKNRKNHENQAFFKWLPNLQFCRYLSKINASESVINRAYFSVFKVCKSDPYCRFGSTFFEKLLKKCPKITKNSPFFAPLNPCKSVNFLDKFDFLTPTGAQILCLNFVFYIITLRQILKTSH